MTGTLTTETKRKNEMADPSLNPLQGAKPRGRFMLYCSTLLLYSALRPREVSAAPSD